MKPRLRKLGGLWSCSSASVVGWGLTPQQAWLMWNGQTVAWPPVAPMRAPVWPYLPPADDQWHWPWYDHGTAAPPSAMPITVSGRH